MFQVRTFPFSAHIVSFGGLVWSVYLIPANQYQSSFCLSNRPLNARKSSQYSIVHTLLKKVRRSQFPCTSSTITTAKLPFLFTMQAFDFRRTTFSSPKKKFWLISASTKLVKFKFKICPPTSANFQSLEIVKSPNFYFCSRYSTSKGNILPLRTFFNHRRTENILVFQRGR